MVDTFKSGMKSKMARRTVEESHLSGARGTGAGPAAGREPGGAARPRASDIPAARAAWGHWRGSDPRLLLSRSDRRTQEVKIFLSRDRAVGEGKLVSLRQVRDVVAHVIEDTPQLNVWNHEILEQCCRKRTIRPVAIRSGLSLLRGVNDQRPGIRFDPGKSAVGAAASAAVRHDHLVREGIASAGVEDHEPKPIRTARRLQNLIETD